MLTHIRIASAKSAPKPYTLSDADGLLLAVQTNGSKLWRFRYRHLGKQKTLHIGPWPDISLADARGRRDEARRQVAAGLDPVQLKVTARNPAENTFRAVGEKWYRKNVDEALAPITLRKIRWLLDIAYRSLATTPVAGRARSGCAAC